MGSTQRADRFEQLYKALKKHYKPVTPPSDRKVLDHLLYACCLEDAAYEAADEAFAKLQQSYFDCNEIRVTTVAELAESMTSLPKASAAANRIKKSLQSMFEARYAFDIEDLKKANLGKAVEEITAWPGMTKYVIDYVTQHALGGHAIPVSETILNVSHTLELISHAEVDKGSLPGVERAIAKTKGIEFGSMLHQFALDYAGNFKHPLVVAVFKDMGMVSKPKAAPPPPPAPPPKIAKPAPDPKALAGKGKTKEAPSTAVKAKPEPKPAMSAAKQVKATEKLTAKKMEVAPPPAKSTKTPPSETTSKSAAKVETSPSKPKAASKKEPTPPSTTKGAKKPTVKPAAKPVQKAPVKKIDTKKVEAKKATDKKSPPPPKTKTKSASASSKPPATKRLPVKPSIKKTKPK